MSFYFLRGGKGELRIDERRDSSLGGAPYEEKNVFLASLGRRNMGRRARCPELYGAGRSGKLSCRCGRGESR